MNGLDIVRAPRAEMLDHQMVTFFIQLKDFNDTQKIHIIYRGNEQM